MMTGSSRNGGITTAWITRDRAWPIMMIEYVHKWEQWIRADAVYIHGSTTFLPIFRRVLAEQFEWQTDRQTEHYGLFFVSLSQWRILFAERWPSSQVSGIKFLLQWFVRKLSLRTRHGNNNPNVGLYYWPGLADENDASLLFLTQLVQSKLWEPLMTRLGLYRALQ